MICIDESGNLGSGGDRYFVIAAVESSNPNRLKNIVKRFNKTNTISEIKGSLLSVPQRQTLLNDLNSVNDYQVTYLIFDKNNFRRTDLLGKNILFNYLSSFLCEYIFKSTSKNEIILCFDNRTVKTASKHSLPEYLQTKCIEWDLNISVNISFYESHQHRGIQIADLISNTIFQSYKHNKKHFYNQINIKKSIKFPYQDFVK